MKVPTWMLLKVQGAQKVVLWADALLTLADALLTLADVLSICTG